MGKVSELDTFFNGEAFNKVEEYSRFLRYLTAYYNAKKFPDIFKDTFNRDFDRDDSWCDKHMYNLMSNPLFFYCDLDSENRRRLTLAVMKYWKSQVDKGKAIYLDEQTR